MRVEVNLSDAVGRQAAARQPLAAGRATVSPASLHRRTASVATSGDTARRSLDPGTDQPEIAPEKAAMLQDNLEDLSEAISRTKYDEAVEQIDRGKRTAHSLVSCVSLVQHELSLVNYSSPVVNSLRMRLEECTQLLVGYIFRELSDPLINRDRLAGHVQRLIVLGYAEEAKERFLVGRSELIKAKARRIQYFGDVFAATALLSSITFDAIDVAFDWFNVSFRDPALVAGFVVWAKNEIARFCEVFAKQAFRRDLPMETVSDCVEDALNKCRRLGRCGLDLTLFLQETLGAGVKDALLSRSQLHRRRATATLDDDDFETIVPIDRPDLPSGLLSPGTRVTESFVQLTIATEALLHDARPLLLCHLSSFCVTAMLELVDGFVERLLHAFYLPARLTVQLLTLASNLDAVAQLLLPHIVAQFTAGEESTVNLSELEELQTRLAVTAETLYVVLGERAGKQAAPLDYTTYSVNRREREAPPVASEWLTLALPALSRMSRDCAPARRSLVLDTTIHTIFTVIQSAHDAQLVRFSSSGLHQFTLDLRLLLRLTGPFLTDNTKTRARDLIETAVGVVAAGDLETPLPPPDQCEHELAQLEASFAKFSLDFGSTQ